MRTTESWIRMFEAVRRIGQTVLCLAFLSLPAIIMLVPDILPTTNLKERATLNQLPRPEWTTKSLRAFPPRFQAYYDDHFGFRDLLVQAHRRIWTLKLGMSPTRRAILGRDGWIFVWDRNERHDYWRTGLYTLSEMDLLNRYLALLKCWADQRGISVVFLVCPNKSTVYPDYMPECMRRYTPPGRMDQFIAACRQAGFPAPDLRPPMQKYRRIKQLYYKSDTHWAAPGTLVAYESLLAALHPVFANLHPRTWSAFQPKRAKTISGDLARMIGCPYEFREPSLALLPPPSAAKLVESTGNTTGTRMVFRQSDTSLPRVIMYFDSFGFGLLPFLAPHFRELVANRNHILSPNDIETYHPDILVIERVERALPDSADLQTNYDALLAAWSNAPPAAALP